MFRGTFAVLLLVASLLATPCVAVPSAESGGEQRIPFKKTEESSAGLVFRVIGGFVVVVLVGVGALYLLKRYLPTAYRPATQGTNRIQVIEVRRLAPKVTLFLIEVDGARILLSQNGERVVTLAGPTSVDKNDEK